MVNKKSIAAGTTAVVLTAAAVLVPNIQLPEKSIGYEITKQSEYVTEMNLDVPGDMNADIVELYVNDIYVDKTILPNEPTLKSNAIVFSKLENLKLKLYKRGKLLGNALYDNEKFVLREE